MKILLQSYAYRPSWGGVQKFVHSLAEHLERHGVRTRLATASYIVISEAERYFAWPWTDTQGTRVNRFNFTALDRARSYPWTNARKVFWSALLTVSYCYYCVLLFLFRPQVVHLVFLNIDAAFAIRAKRRFHFKLLVSFRGSDILNYDNLSAFRRALTLETLAVADAVTTVSEEMSAQVRRLLTSDRVPVLVIPNGIVPDRHTGPATQGQPANAFIFVGHLDDNKNPEVLVRTFQIFLRSYPDYRLVLVGTGPLLEPLRAMVAGSPLHSAVELRGQLSQEKTLDLIRQSAALVLPSAREGCPNVVLEAMASGTPVIGANRSGIKELIVHRSNGLLFEHNSTEELMNCMVEVTQSAELRRSLIENALATVRRKHDHDQIMHRYLALYEQLNS